MEAREESAERLVEKQFSMHTGRVRYEVERVRVERLV